MNTKLVYIGVLFVLLFSMSYAQENALQRVEIPGSQLQKITSSIVGQEYTLYITLPRGYQDTTRRFPVVFLLDAQWDFPLVTSLHGEQYYDGFIPGLIIVGITWGGDNPNPDSLRQRDLSPTHTTNVVQSGGGAKFLSFIKRELIPFIESKYRTTTDRTLIGSSYGGLFTLFAMFNETELFKTYILTSPYLSYDSDVIYSVEKKYSEKNKSLNAKLFMAHGEVEGGVPGFTRFVEQLKSRKYNGLELQTRILENTGHSGTKAEGYTRGLQFVFAKPSIKIADTILDQYIGIFQLPNGATARVMKENDRLITQLPWTEPLVLHASTETDFYVLGRYLNFRAQKDEAGKITGLLLEEYNGELILKKIK